MLSLLQKHKIDLKDLSSKVKNQEDSLNTAKTSLASQAEKLDIMQSEVRNTSNMMSSHDKAFEMLQDDNKKQAARINDQAVIIKNLTAAVSEQNVHSKALTSRIDNHTSMIQTLQKQQSQNMTAHKQTIPSKTKAEGK